MCQDFFRECLDRPSVPSESFIDVLFEHEMTYVTLKVDEVDWHDQRKRPILWRLTCTKINDLV